MMSGKCISHFKMLRSVSGTYYWEVAVKAGENDPFKKPPPPERRKYDPVGDWTPADGYPDSCSAKIGSYNSLITHRGRCPNKQKQK